MQFCVWENLSWVYFSCHIKMEIASLLAADHGYISASVIVARHTRACNKRVILPPHPPWRGRSPCPGAAPPGVSHQPALPRFV